MVQVVDWDLYKLNEEQRSGLTALLDLLLFGKQFISKLPLYPSFFSILTPEMALKLK